MLFGTDCSAIRGREETCDIPFIFLSSQVDKKTLQQGKEIGGAYFIAKPFKMDVVLKRIDEVFSRG